MKLYATLKAINSRRDVYGNCYWAFVYTDHESGQQVCGKISGGESNINGIRRCMDRVDGWDSGIRSENEELGIRDFNRMTKNWDYAGCTPEELAQFIKDKFNQGAFL